MKTKTLFIFIITIIVTFQSHSMQTIQYIPIPSVLEKTSKKMSLIKEQTNYQSLTDQQLSYKSQSNPSLHMQENTDQKEKIESFVTDAYKKTKPQLHKSAPENVCITIDQEKEKIQEIQQQNNADNMVSALTLTCVTGLSALAALIPVWILVGIWCGSRTTSCF